MDSIELEKTGMEALGKLHEWLDEFSYLYSDGEDGCLADWPDFKELMHEAERVLTLWQRRDRERYGGLGRPVRPKL